MDTSETYIKMCDCEEIQGLRPVKYDWLDNLYYGRTILQPDHAPFLFGSSDDKLDTMDSIWLPRQDQLQEMVGQGWEGCKCFDDIPLTVILVSLYSFEKHNVLRTIELNINSPASMEQLWLAFVMKEKYNKVWDGSNWEA